MKLFTPSDGPPWLRRFADSIIAAFKQVMDAPFRPFQVATADLPAAADWKGGVSWNTTNVRVTYSDGSAWQELQPYTAALNALGALTPAANKVPYFTSGSAAALADFTASGRAVVALSWSAGTQIPSLTAAGTASFLTLDTDTALAANSDSKITTQKATKTYVDNAVTGLFDLKGSTNCSANPNYPSASKGDAYVVSAAGKIGGASGTAVDIGDVFVASADNAGGTQASVGTSWFILEHNLAGALLTANNLSDLASASTARTNLGLVIGTNVQAWDADLDAVAASGIASAWTAYTPTVAAGTGAFTTVAAAGRWKQIGKTVFLEITVTITTNGTAASYFTVTAPTTSANPGTTGIAWILIANETAVGGLAGQGKLFANSTTIFVAKYDSTYLGGNGQVINMTGVYEAA